MDYTELKSEALSVTLSEEAQELVFEIGMNHQDPVEASILGFSCGMLAVRNYVKEAIEHE